MEIALIIAIVAPIIGILIARAKGRSELGGCALGCLLGPLGWLILALLPSRVEHGIRPSEARRCPYCAETIRAAATVCRFCGRDLPPAKPDKPRLLVPKPGGPPTDPGGTT